MNLKIILRNSDKSNMRLLGIDFGTKNIGVAISDDNMKIASP